MEERDYYLLRYLAANTGLVEINEATAPHEVKVRFEFTGFDAVKTPNSIYVRLLKMRAVGLVDKGGNSFSFAITDAGRKELEAYQKKLDEAAEKAEMEKKKAQLEIDQMQSVVDTNKSVKSTNDFVVSNTGKQNKLTLVSLIVAGASALFAFGAMYATLRDTTGEEVRLLRLQLQKQSQTQEQMLQSQQEIDSSMKVFLERSFNKGTSNRGKSQ